MSHSYLSLYHTVMSTSHEQILNTGVASVINGFEFSVYLSRLANFDLVRPSNTFKTSKRNTDLSLNLVTMLETV